MRFTLNLVINNPLGKIFMKDFTTYLSTAPVLAAVWFGVLAGLLIEVNRFYPDALTF